jgi:tRNA nucleotidyltransferase (CCA-adding enzyme)
MKDKLKVDLSTARKEVYGAPGALPVVEFSSLKDDLFRRDFTINAMAISLNKTNFGRLIDFFGGEFDLAGGNIKVMHDRSFIDDPTRIFRAVRFEQRLGFRIDYYTEELIRKAIKKEMFDKVQPQRIREEVILILKENLPLKALKRMAELDELRFLDDGIRLDRNLIRLYTSVDKACEWYDSSIFKKRAIDKWLIYMMALFDRLSCGDVSKICKKFIFRRGDTIRILSYKKHSRAVIKMLSSGMKCAPSKIYRTLEPLSFEVILLIMAKVSSESARSKIKDFFQKYNGMRTRVNGADLKAMGLSPCPDYKNILEGLLYKKIDGKLKTKTDELAYAGKLIKKIRGN